MAFSSLSTHEKDAFFSLLDEYFDSRPSLLNVGAHSEPSGARNLQPSAAAAAVAAAATHAATSNPQLISRGLKSITAPPPKVAPKPAPSSAEVASDEQEADTAPVSVRSRVAAASQLFSQQTSQSPAPARPGNGLVSSRNMGDVALSSGKDFFGSIRNSTAKKNAPPPSFPSTETSPFPAKKSAFAPPPVRRISSQGGEVTAASSSPPPPPPPVSISEPQSEGEWAEALYDYKSGEAGDLEISENDRILVTDRSDEDWWRGEVDGRSGLFPASYARLL